MFFVDSHCHLKFSRFVDAFNAEVGFENKYGVEAIVKRAINANVRCMLNIGTELTDMSYLQEFAETYETVFHTVGVHALEAAKHYELYSLDEISKIIRDNYSHPKVVGIGEIGLDYHYEKESRKQQDTLFNLQLDLAKECGLPVSIHSREAIDDTISVLKNHPDINGVIHCFSGEKHFAEQALDLGFFISISGVITYKKATELQDTLKYIPRDRLLIETDSPFLAPVPFRGKINEPSFVVYVAQKIAELLGIPVEDVAKFSSKNFFNLFSGKTFPIYK
ncbi:MAG: TatD family hydrolase [Holosporaceae bacterium]|jgi:TatD DNase family protein|nr:TatD family hydrolase [Holosporaceae bacterium]